MPNKRGGYHPFKPKVFVSRIKWLRIVLEPPKRDPHTGVACWGLVVVFKNGTYIPKNKKEQELLLKHSAFGKEFWLQEQPVRPDENKVLDMATIPTPPNAVEPK